MKLTKKDLFYISLILLLALTFGVYNLRDRLLNTSIGKTIVQVVDTVNTERNKIVIDNETRYPKPSVILTEGEFKDLILKEIPITSQDASDLKKVTALREWVFLNVPTADSNMIIDNLSTIPLNKIPGRIRIQIFREGLAGAWCGTTSRTLREVYNLFGYEAYDVNLGNTNIADTHVITIVKIKNENKYLFSVQDAYLNYSLTDKLGKPLDYFTVLALLRNREENDIIFQWGKKDGRFQKPYLVSQKTKSDSIIKTTLSGNIVEYKRFAGYFNLVQRIKPLLFSHSYPDSFIYLYLFPFGVYGKDYEKAQLILNIARSVSGTWCKDQYEC